MYPLTPLQLAYSLAINPYVLPHSTMVAYGSVTEPFLPETRERALEYIKTIHEWLKLPSQVSTKSILDDELTRELKNTEPNISVLVTIIAMGEKARRLEPNAPPAEDRLESMIGAGKKGLSVAVFMRPIIPGVTDNHYKGIIDKAVDGGVRHIVLGSLRVTRRIISALGATGVDTGLITRRLTSELTDPKKQVSINTSDLKIIITGYARSKGMIVHPSACSHNMWSHRIGCHACSYGPCYTMPRIPDEEELREAVEILGGRIDSVVVKYPYIVLRGLKGVRRDVVVGLLEAATKLMVRIR